MAAMARPMAAAVAALAVLAALVTLASLPVAQAHVALTYPPARKYDLDFLDNSRTRGPCGMPKGEYLSAKYL